MGVKSLFLIHNPARYELIRTEGEKAKALDYQGYRTNKC